MRAGRSSCALWLMRLEARIYDATSIKDIQLARDTVVARLVDDAAELDAELLVLERDDESVAADRSTILARRKLTGRIDMPRFVDKGAHEDCLLSVPDAVAWAWSKAGHWRDRVKPLVGEVVRVDDPAGMPVPGSSATRSTWPSHPPNSSVRCAPWPGLSPAVQTRAGILRRNSQVAIGRDRWLSVSCPATVCLLAPRGCYLATMY
jgi:hypothetical protein